MNKSTDREARGLLGWFTWSSRFGMAMRCDVSPSGGEHVSHCRETERKQRKIIHAH